MIELPDRLCNTILDYVVSTKNRAAYEEELHTWIDNGWLISHLQERLGPPKGLIPFMSIEQPTKHKIRPIDYRELNQHVDAFTGYADVCAAKLQE